MRKGHVAAKAPVKVEVEAGKDYWWCACGLSKNQPFCDGSHKGSDFSPVQWTADESGDKWFCGCKQTDGQPFCDGRHNSLNEPEPAEGKSASITPRENGPLVVKNGPDMTTDSGTIEAKPIMALCRCGQSNNKPFCDGSHTDAGFSDARGDTSKEDRVFTYGGEDATVAYNLLLCSHAAECVRRAPEAFDPSRKPWIIPDYGPTTTIHAVVKACPSGALRISEPGGEPQHLIGDDVSIHIQKHGPYWVRNISLERGHEAKGSTSRKYVLCRCGLSKNKPYCDGTHRDAGWRDDDTGK